MGKPMRIRATAKDGSTEVKILMNHEMETGQRKDSSGALISAHHITELTIKLNGKAVLNGQFGPSVAKNPFLSFSIKGGKAGDDITVFWIDNKGDSREDVAKVG